MVFIVYFSQWLVVENHVADIWYNFIFVGASLLLAVTVPLAAIRADRFSGRTHFLRLLTISQFLLLAVTGLLASYTRYTSLVLTLTVVCYGLSIYCHQFALVFYNALLPDIAQRGTQGFVSGVGQCAKWLGTMAGLFIALPFVHSASSAFGHPGRSRAFLPATIISSLLTIPALFIREPKATVLGAVENKVDVSYAEKARRLLWHPGVASYLLAFFLFNDAILTVQDNMPIYMQRVMLITDRAKSIVLALGLIGAAVGAVSGGKVGDRIGLKRSLTLILAAWVLFLPALASVRTFNLFTAALVLMGFMYGMTWAVTRAVMAYLAPSDQLTHAFGYYTLAERFSTFIGPVTWGAIVTIGSHHEVARYRVALMSMAVFVAAGLAASLRIPNDRPPKDQIETGSLRN
jgi:UMF1 family MFS transporter